MVKVSDTKTGKLLRFESDGGTPIAVRRGKRLVLTAFGRRQKYVVRGLRVYEGGAKYPAY